MKLSEYIDRLRTLDQEADVVIRVVNGDVQAFLPVAAVSGTRFERPTDGKAVVEITDHFDPRAGIGLY